MLLFGNRGFGLNHHGKSAVSLILPALFGVMVTACSQPETGAKRSGEGDVAPTAREAEKAALARTESLRQTLALIDSGDLEVARARAQAMIDRPGAPEELPDGHRLLAKIFQAQHNAYSARAELEAARAVVPSGAAQTARTSVILLELAQLYAGDLHDSTAAIAYYDQARQSGGLSPGATHAAAINAGMLEASQGHFAAAIRRIDERLAAAPPGSIAVQDMVNLLTSQASFALSAQDVAGARARYQRIWDEFGARNDRAIVHTGIQLARWISPITSDQCVARVSMCQALFAKLDAVRAGHGGVLPPKYDGLEDQVRVLVADCADCPGQAEAAAEARRQLGLPPRQ